MSLMDDYLVIFISGRTFSFARPILSHLVGHYHFAVQNGAALYEMPNVLQLKKHYLGSEAIEKLEPIFTKEEGGLLVESGQERDDICYYKPADFSQKERDYLDHRISFSPETWVPLTSFKDAGLTEFAVGKFFAPREDASRVAKEVNEQFGFNVVVIHDPFRPGSYLAHINSPEASKGHILQEFVQMQEKRLPIISAGDDYNDVHMWEKSDIKIVMQNAPEDLHHHADILAPPAQEQGIIAALKEALR
ncbi:MAG: hypothetical protein S4CHLAM45_13750 [Chlamydiales bacterium]|nr:hypothetical protein [Chlamydiales bacterium]MCH9620480.1 hypothetical protein [Chlamydiales bacterium]MCH9623465.1 hypothetical protein [Chlamydiales bacterium]